MILDERYNYPGHFYQQSEATLNTALNTAPAYKAWQQLDPGAGFPINDRYAAIPELTKQMIRDYFPTGLVPNFKDVDTGLLNGEIEYSFTSGTTGDRVINIWDQDWWDRAEAASWKLNAHTAHFSYPQREAKLASSLNVGISCEEDLPYESRIVGHRLFLNEKINLIQWQPRHFQRMADELYRFQPVIIEANPSLLARLAFWAIDNQVDMYQPSVIVYSYEFISAIHTKAIAKVFNAPQISSYGTSETGFVLEECEAGLLHQNIDFCRIDFHPLKDEFGGPELGRMLVTTFGNPWNTVIKFGVGDLVRLHPLGECACGRNLGLIGQVIEGRVGNSTFTTTGGLVTTLALDRKLAEIDGIRDYLLEQDSPNEYLVDLMVDENNQDILDKTTLAMQELYGSDGRFNIRIQRNLLPGQAGKFRRSQANFDFDEMELFV